MFFICFYFLMNAVQTYSWSSNYFVSLIYKNSITTILYKFLIVLLGCSSTHSSRLLLWHYHCCNILLLSLVIKRYLGLQGPWQLPFLPLVSSNTASPCDNILPSPTPFSDSCCIAFYLAHDFSMFHSIELGICFERYGISDNAHITGGCQYDHHWGMILVFSLIIQFGCRVYPLYRVHWLSLSLSPPEYSPGGQILL